MEERIVGGVVMVVSYTGKGRGKTRASCNFLKLGKSLE